MDKVIRVENGKIINATRVPNVELKNQTLSFTNLVATVSITGVTADTPVFVWYHDTDVATAAGITGESISGGVQFTATSTPSNDVVVDIVVM